MGERNSKPMRELMPVTTAFLDMLRETFPDAEVAQSIRDGLAGQPRFWASENGYEIGTPITMSPNAFVLDSVALARHVAEFGGVGAR